MFSRFLRYLLCLTLIILPGCTNEYFDYHARQTAYNKDQALTRSALETWNIASIPETDISIFTSPPITSLDRIIETLRSAKNRIWLEVYMLSEKRIIAALAEAQTRGVDVRIILEPNPYGNPYINKKAFTTLENKKIAVSWADGSRFNFTHAKFFVIDDSYLIMTANMTHSAFATNREFYIEGHDSKILETLSRIFESDMAHTPIEITHPNLIISPIDARTKLVTLLESAKKSILLYAEVFDDEALKQILIRKAQENIPVTIILTNPKKIAANQAFIDSLSPFGIRFFTPKKPIIHAKAAIIDSSVAYVGSINFTKNSLENNREVGVLFKNPKAI